MDDGTYPFQVTIRRALDWSQAATVRTSDGRLLRLRIVVGWDSPTASWLDEASGGGSILDLALIAVALTRDGIRALRYRLRGRRDWCLIKQVDDDNPVVAVHPDRTRATDEAEQELQAAVRAGGRYLPYGQ